MRVVAGLADTAVDSLAEDDEGATPTPAASSGCDAPAQRGTDAVGLRLRVEAGDAGRPSLPPDPPDGHLRPFPGTPMGPRETARYGLRALRIGGASHPGPPEDGGGDMSRLRHAAAIAERVARIDELVTGMRAEYQTLQAERFALVGAYTSAGLAGAAPPGSPRAARRSRTPSSSSSGSNGAPPSSDGGGTSHGTSHTTTSSFFARIRGDPGAGTGEGHDTPPLAYGTDDVGVWSVSPGSPDGGSSSGERTRGSAVGSSHEVPSRWQGPDTPEGKVCGCRPGVPFTPPMLSANVAAARGISPTHRRLLVILPLR